MLNLTLVRHGVTIENEKGICQGQTEGTLSPKGILANTVLAKSLKNTNFDIIFTSPLDRAYQTALSIKKHSPTPPLSIDNRLMEWHMGDLQGNKMPKPFDTSQTIPNAEPISSLIKRVELFLNDIKANNNNNNILAVTHGVTIQAFILIINKLPKNEMHQIEIIKNSTFKTFQIK